jgi:hypothetical protein
MIVITMTRANALRYLADLKRADEVCEGEGIGPDLAELINIFEQALDERSKNT